MMDIAEDCPGLFEFVNNSVNAMIRSTKLEPICETFTLGEEPTTAAYVYYMDNVTQASQVHLVIMILSDYRLISSYLPVICFLCVFSITNSGTVCAFD